MKGNVLSTFTFESTYHFIYLGFWQNKKKKKETETEKERKGKWKWKKKKMMIQDQIFTMKHT